MADSTCCEFRFEPRPESGHPLNDNSPYEVIKRVISARSVELFNRLFCNNLVFVILATEQQFEVIFTMRCEIF